MVHPTTRFRVTGMARVQYGFKTKKRGKREKERMKVNVKTLAQKKLTFDVSSDSSIASLKAQIGAIEGTGITDLSLVTLIFQGKLQGGGRALFLKCEPLGRESTDAAALLLTLTGRDGAAFFCRQNPQG